MRIAMIAALTMLATTAALAADLYPGARPDPQVQANTQEFYRQYGVGETKKATVYSTTDPWEKVAEHYRRSAREYKPPGREGYDLDFPKSISFEGPGKVARVGSGIRGKQAFFILDDAKELYLSSRWVMVTTPKFASVKANGRMNDPAGIQFAYDGIQNGVTVITIVESR
jgi:hypothetical protein